MLRSKADEHVSIEPKKAYKEVCELFERNKAAIVRPAADEYYANIRDIAEKAAYRGERKVTAHYEFPAMNLGDFARVCNYKMCDADYSKLRYRYENTVAEKKVNTDYADAIKDMLIYRAGADGLKIKVERLAVTSMFVISKIILNVTVSW